MDNLKLPAYPMAYQFGKEYNHDCVNESGFTKLELASLIPGSGLLASYHLELKDNAKAAQQFVELAKAVLEQANK